MQRGDKFDLVSGGMDPGILTMSDREEFSRSLIVDLLYQGSIS
ncbi:unnamed protein product [Acidithrix sp. C25]|nr:unnamed protein product [Acidithrix sp. C25]